MAAIRRQGERHETPEGGLAGQLQLEAEQRGEMASRFQWRKLDAYPAGMWSG